MTVLQVPQVRLSLAKKANGDLNVSLARLFIHAMRWILIIAPSVTCLDMSRDLQQNHRFSIFVTLDMIRDVFFFFFIPEVWIEESKQSTDQEEKLLQQCQAGEEKSKQRGRNEFIPHSAVVKAINSLLYAGCTLAWLNYCLLCCINPLCCMLS